MAISTIPKSAFEFLRELSKNNDRNWFAANKAVYQLEATHIAAFAEHLLQALNRHDVIETPSGSKSL
jgi:uncharacterized protein (DUF2461 family)